MASIAIPSAGQPRAPQGVVIAKAAPQAAATTARPVLQPDTVKLSAAAQARIMRQAGQSPALIAATLGTNVSSVDGYLGITVAKQAATPMPAAAPSPNPTAPLEEEKTATPQPATATPAASGKS
jgi:hypothetical protein